MIHIIFVLSFSVTCAFVLFREKCLWMQTPVQESITVQARQMISMKSVAYFACKPGSKVEFTLRQMLFSGAYRKTIEPLYMEEVGSGGTGEKGTGTGTFSTIDSQVIKKIRVNCRVGGFVGLVMKPDILS